MFTITLPGISPNHAVFLKSAYKDIHQKLNCIKRSPVFEGQLWLYYEWLTDFNILTVLSVLLIQGSIIVGNIMNG